MIRKYQFAYQLFITLVGRRLAAVLSVKLKAILFLRKPTWLIVCFLNICYQLKFSTLHSSSYQFSLLITLISYANCNFNYLHLHFCLKKMFENVYVPLLSSYIFYKISYTIDRTIYLMSSVRQEVIFEMVPVWCLFTASFTNLNQIRVPVYYMNPRFFLKFKIRKFFLRIVLGFVICLLP